MIDVVSIQELRGLGETHRGWCVSIYLPTHVAGGGTGQDTIRFKNALARAARDLESLGTSGHDADALLAPARSLLDDRDFWAHAGNGLAVFVTGDRMWTYRLAEAVEEVVVVAGRFHVTPLLTSVVAGGNFHVLALGQNRIRLLEGNQVSLEELAVDEIPEIPASLAEALRFDDREPQLQSHGAVRAGTGRVIARFHGQGPGEVGRDSDLERFLRAVDVGVCKVTGDGGPLVLAGVQRTVAAFRRVTHHPFVVDQAVTGNPERLRPDELHARAWPLARSSLDVGRQKVRDRMRTHPDRVVTTLPTVLIAARDGRIESLFVQTGMHRWGRVDADRREIVASDEQRLGDLDLLDVATADTLSTGGAVYAVDRSDMPGDGPLAALLRY